MTNLDSLKELVSTKKSEPTQEELIKYLFWEKGIGEKEFNETSIPYIISIIKTYNYIKKLEEKELKKIKKRK